MITKEKTTEMKPIWKKILQFAVEVIELIIAIFGGVELSNIITL